MLLCLVILSVSGMNIDMVFENKKALALGRVAEGS